MLIQSKIVSGQNLRPYIISSNKSFFSGDVCILHPRFGNLILEIQDPYVVSCTICMKRISGNGIFMTSSAGKSNGHQIKSLTAESVSLPIGKDRKIHIHRTQRGFGDLGIIEMVLFENSINWNAELSKSKGHACLRLVNDFLHASEGAWIKADDIVVVTDPPNMFRKTDGEVKFLGSCRILELRIEGKEKHSEPPIQVLQLPVNPQEPKVLELTKAEVAKDLNNVVYDTKSAGFQNIYCNEQGKVTSTGVIIDFRGGYNIPITLKPNTNYKIKIDVTRIDGNGKFMFGILPNNANAPMNVAVNNTNTFNIEVATNDSDQYNLSIWRPQGSKGRILLSRIAILSESDSSPIQIREIRPYIKTQPIIVPNIKTEIVPVSFSTTPVKGVSDNNYDPITEISLKYARPLKEEYIVENPIDTNSTIKTNTFSGLMWLNRVQPYIPNISFSETPVASISKIGNLLKARKMYIECFDESIPDSDIDALRQAERLFVCSNLNAEAIRNKIGDVDIHVGALPLPYITSKPLSLVGGDYFVLTQDNPEITNYLISAFGKIKIVLLNARGNFPKNIFPVNEYISYDKLLYIIENAKGYIFFPKFEDEISSQVDLALSLGIKVITSSWAYMDLTEVIFLNNNHNVGERKIPVASEIANQMKNIQRSDKNLTAINCKFNNFTTTFFS